MDWMKRRFKTMQIDSHHGGRVSLCFAQNRAGNTINLRFLNILIAIVLVVILTGCGKKETRPVDEEKKLRVVAAIFPAWDWTRNVLGNNPAEVNLSLLVDNGVDLHSFQPSVDDILTISNADLFIYVGGESDQWVTDALKQAKNPDIRILKMLDTIGDAAKTEETVEGMQSEEEEGDALDEHVWLSLRSASMITDAIAGELSALDPENAKFYSENAAAYKEKLSALDAQYQQTVTHAEKKTLLFGDRFPFRYLVDDYGLSYYAAFSGCSAETEASFETISFLAQKCNELALPVVLKIDGSDGKIAETIVKNTDAKDQTILTLDSMQSVTAKDIQDGTDYLSVMEKNLDVLKQALGEE